MRGSLSVVKHRESLPAQLQPLDSIHQGDAFHLEEVGRVSDAAFGAREGNADQAELVVV